MTLWIMAQNIFSGRRGPLSDQPRTIYRLPESIHAPDGQRLILHAPPETIARILDGMRPLARMVSFASVSGRMWSAGINLPAIFSWIFRTFERRF